ncbi:DNA polymerase IV [Nitritalea halalkaliphila LW7]|uniref:DNA polymerase IV n=1 Tax=Nitritalea halalkaliphila LW7 TaxID=1189621 RepID=I5C4M8_9BACT|nr:DNA polymerase IV [Nitritalea halalkaliphila]EIM76780.1 DNA polymerase IV [Nitritalea halalkaliphila LW7]
MNKQEKERGQEAVRWRKIIHVDMDAFFASVEQRDHPELRGKPVAVGGDGERGVVAAASYEARAYGVRSAMPGKLAIRKCPHLLFVPPRFSVYKEVSQQVQEIFFSFTDFVEPLSLDEAFLDVTENKFGYKSAIYMAYLIRKRIFQETGLTASAGVSYNKFLAKTASDLRKPNGQAVILPEDAAEFLERLPVEKFYGVGKVTAAKLNRFGIYSGADLKSFSLAFLTKHFGKSGQHYYQIVRGIHDSPVQPDRMRKSISVESTFEQDISARNELDFALQRLLEDLKKRLRKQGLKGRTAVLKLKYSDFSQQTRSRSQEHYIPEEALEEFYRALLEQEPLKQPIRLMGVGLQKLNTQPEQHGVQLHIVFP